MVYGRGIYMSDNPSFCKKYGNSLILSRVLRPIDPGYGRVVSKNWCNVFVIPDPRQILPYCVIKLQRWDDLQMLLHSLICMYNANVAEGCLIPMCRETKSVLLHMRSCDLKSYCTVKDCFSTWTTIQHWIQCQKQVCDICFAYRKFMATQVNNVQRVEAEKSSRVSSSSSSANTPESESRRCPKRTMATTSFTEELKSKKPRTNPSNTHYNYYNTSSDNICPDSCPSPSESEGNRKLPDDAKLLDDTAMKSWQMTDGLSDKALRANGADYCYVPQLHHPLLSSSDMV